jgi:CyaY protein
MDEKEFDKRSREALGKLEAALRDASDALDVDLADGILTLEFEDGAKYVVNSHGAAQQIWLSANMSASHFGWHEATTRPAPTRSGRAVHRAGAAGGREAREPVSCGLTRSGRQRNRRNSLRRVIVMRGRPARRGPSTVWGLRQHPEEVAHHLDLAHARTESP